jgi:hypothetical protein
VKLYDSALRIQIQNVRPYCVGSSFSLVGHVTNCTELLPGNVFRVQLSNSSGSFAAPTVIGTRSSAVGGSIACTLPAGLSGPGYKLRIIASNPALTSDTVAIVIHPFPVPTITITGNTLSTGSYASYQWSRNGAPISGATTASYTPTLNGQYTVSVTDANGCSGVSAVFNLTKVGVAEPGVFAGVHAYPNPATDYLIVEGAAGMDLVIHSPDGRMAARASITTDHYVVPVRQLPSGIYIGTLSAASGERRLLKIVRR